MRTQIPAKNVVAGVLAPAGLTATRGRNTVTVTGKAPSIALGNAQMVRMSAPKRRTRLKGMIVRPRLALRLQRKKGHSPRSPEMRRRWSQTEKNLKMHIVT